MSEEIFLERYNRLNKEQKRAVDTIDGPVQVLAGPGTGKTTILTLRIAQILRKTDTPASGILALTYSSAGARAMRDKLREIIGNRAHDVYIHTFHNFAAAMMNEYPDHFLFTRDFRQMSDVESEALIRDILTDPKFALLRPLGRTDAYVSSILRAISDVKKEAMNPEQLREFARKEKAAIESDEDNISTRGASKGGLKAAALEQLQKLDKTMLLSDIYETYEAKKKELKLEDYDDLIIDFLVALHEDTLLLHLIQERFLYILVDEHQDTNDAQNDIVSFIAEFFETPNVFIVGDENQAIYRFQGASVENFRRLSKRYPAMQTIALDTNYRSHQSILDASFAMIERNYDGDESALVRVKLAAGGKESVRAIDLVAGENMPAMEKYLVDEVRRIESQEPEATVAIITRRNRELDRVLALFESAGINVSSERSIDIFHHPVGMAFFDLLEYLADSSRTDALAKTFVAGLWGLSIHKAIELVTALKRSDMEMVEKEIPGLAEVRLLLHKDGAINGLIETAEHSGFVSLISRDPTFIHVWRGIVVLAESLAREQGIESPQTLFASLLAYRMSAEHKPVKVAVGAPDVNVKAMTAHGSKGLEFDYVFVPYAQEETWIGRNRGTSFVLPKKQSPHEVADMRRLFYVALTRAKKHAVILYAESESSGEGLTPLRFIEELAPEHVKTTHLPLVHVSHERGGGGKSVESEFERAVADHAKHVLLTSGLSVTALNHFLECPSKFLYESILKLPQEPSISAEKGNAMHAAISRVWHLDPPSRSFGEAREIMEKIITETVTEYIDKSLLAKGDKEAVKHELVKNAPIVAKALENHFNVNPEQAKVYTERWIETAYEAKYERENFRISIHGKLDAIVSMLDRADIYDYKTRQAMSENEIRGARESDKDKPARGNYFRQLVYYHMLLRGHNEFNRKSLTASLVFVSPDEKGRCPIITLPVSEEDMRNVQSEIQKVVESVWSGRIAKEYCEEKDCEYCAYRRLMK